jgi:hypothetical protein
VLIGSDAIHELWCRAGSSYLLRLMAVAVSIWKVFRVADLFLSFPSVRCLMRSFRQLVPSAEAGRCGIIGMLDKLCQAGRKRSLMAHFADR